MKELVSRASTPRAAAALADDADFLKVIARAGARRDALAYLNLAGVKSVLTDAIVAQGDLDRATAEAVFRAMGLGAVRSVSVLQRVDPPGIRTELFVHAPAPRGGVFTLLSDEPISAELLAMAPPESRGIVAWRLRTDRFVSLVRNVLASVEPGAAAQVDAALAQVSTGLGVDIQTQVLRGLGGEGALIFAEGSFIFPQHHVPPMSAFADIALVLRVAHPKDFRPVYQRLTGLGGLLAGDAGLTLVTSSGPAGASIAHVALPLGFSPAIGMSNDFLVISPTRDGVRRILERATGTRPSLRTNAPFTAALERTGSSPGFWLVYTAPMTSEQIAPLLSLVPLAVSTAYGAACLGGEELSPARELIGAIQLTKLPPADTIARHALPLVQTGWTNDDGIGMTTWGIGLGVAPAMAAAALGAAAASGLVPR
jgi:hypothetical protein